MDQAAQRKSKQKLTWGLILLIGPTALIIVAILLYALINFIFGSAAGTEDPGVLKKIVNIVLYIVGAVSVIALVPGIVIGIILIATRNSRPTAQQQLVQSGSVATPVRGRSESITGLVITILGFSPLGLILSIIGLVKSKRAGKPDVIAIIGVVLGGLGTLAVAAIITVLVVVGSGNIQDNARDTQRQADASSILTAAEQYRSANQGAYPATDPAGFRMDVASAYETGTDLSALDNITMAGPSAAHENDYGITPCRSNGTVTGIEVSYYHAAHHRVQSIATGSGCSAPQNVSPDDPSSVPEADL